MRSLKKLTKNYYSKEIFGWLSYLYIQFVYFSSNWKTVYTTDIRNELQEPFIYAFWHGRLIMMPYLAPKHRPMNVLISNHSDGQIISAAMRYFGFKTIIGSTGKSGLTAFREIIRKLRDNQNVSITPDGPRGPRMRISGNIIGLAQKTGKPIIPITFSVSKYKILRSWDQMLVPKPFSHGLLLFGRPINIPKESSAEELQQYRIQLEDEMNRITAEADMGFGINIVKPENN